MNIHKLFIAGAASGALLLFGGMAIAESAYAQAPAATAGTEDTAAPEPLSEADMEILVARIALYPDELVAAIVSASLYPLQIVQAQRYLEQVKAKPSLKPDPNWDGSVVSLMNYPEVVKMMSDDLDWTQALAAAVANQQKDMLEAIQQLRDKAVAEGVIKSDDKVKVVKEDDNIVIQPASADKIYVPRYEPEMLYEPDYVYAPVTYYPEPYPSYYYPTAPYFAGFVTGAIWASAVDWNHWGVWGGNNWGNDINIDCNHCFNNNDFNGKININDVDWKNVDRNKINFDKNQFNKIDSTKIRNSLEANGNNSIKNKAANIKNDRPTNLPGKVSKPDDIRKSTLEGLKKGDSNYKPGQGAGNKLPNAGGGGNVSKPGAGNKLPNAGGGNTRPSAGNFDKPISKPKPGAKPDVRPKNPSPMGDVTRGRDAKAQSKRGGQSMGGGLNMGGGGGMPKMGDGGGRGGGGGGKKAIRRR